MVENRVQGIGFRVRGKNKFFLFFVLGFNFLVSNLLFLAFCFLNPEPCFLSPVCFAQNKFTYDAKGKRDPFMPLVTSDGRILKLDTEETKGPLSLEGIIYDEKGLSYAIVNGIVVKLGDVIEGNQVLKIEKGKVIFIKEGNTFNLDLIDKEGK